MIHAGPLRPDSLPRESKTSLETVLTISGETIPYEDAPPYFAFTTWGQRPALWLAGTWRVTARQVIAVTPVLGGSQLDLLPGAHFGWLRLDHKRGSAPVIELGRITVT